MEGSVSPKRNKLLALLSKDAYGQLQPHLEFCHFPAGTVLHDTAHALRHATFPVSGLVGRVGATTDGKSTELTVCGLDGMIGVSILLGGRPLSSRALVLSEMAGFKVPAPVILSVWRHSEAFQTLMLRYVQVLLQEVMQIALCNKHHTVEQQLSRWLLMAVDRLGEEKMHVTQSVISHMLGVRREGVTEAAGKLQSHGTGHRARRHRKQRSEICVGRGTGWQT